MYRVVFLPCPADLNIFLRPMVRPDDGFNYYASVLTYVDNVMIIHHDTGSVLRRIYKYFKLNPSSIGDPDIYLGTKLKKRILENVVWAWANSLARYVKLPVANVEKYLSELSNARWQLPKNKAENSFVGYYATYMEKTPDMEQDLASWYQSLIFIIRCVAEIGREQIITNVSMMESHIVMPMEGHLEVFLHVFVFLRQKYNSRVLFDPTYPAINMIYFKEWKWKDFYGELK